MSRSAFARLAARSVSKLRCLLSNDTFTIRHVGRPSRVQQFFGLRQHLLRHRLGRLTTMREIANSHRWVAQLIRRGLESTSASRSTQWSNVGTGGMQRLAVLTASQLDKCFAGRIRLPNPLPRPYISPYCCKFRSRNVGVHRLLPDAHEEHLSHRRSKQRCSEMVVWSASISRLLSNQQTMHRLQSGSEPYTAVLAVGSPVRCRLCQWVQYAWNVSHRVPFCSDPAYSACSGSTGSSCLC